MSYPLHVRRMPSAPKTIAAENGKGKKMRRLMGWEALCILMGVPFGTRHLICPLCDTALDMYDGTSWDSDHAISEAMGGLSVKGNLIAVCTFCNASKRDIDLPKYIRLVAFTADGLSYTRGDDAVNLLAHLGISGGIGTRDTHSPIERAARRAWLIERWA